MWRGVRNSCPANVEQKRQRFLCASQPGLVDLFAWTLTKSESDQKQPASQLYIFSRTF
jgi:hypothetical protein